MRGGDEGGRVRRRAGGSTEQGAAVACSHAHGHSQRAAAAVLHSSGPHAAQSIRSAPLATEGSHGASPPPSARRRGGGSVVCFFVCGLA